MISSSVLISFNIGQFLLIKRDWHLNVFWWNQNLLVIFYPVREFNLNNNKKRVDIVVVVLDTAMTLALL
jgi:hypothetical protein